MRKIPCLLGAALAAMLFLVTCSPEKAKEETAPEIKFNISGGGNVSQTSDGNALVEFKADGGSASVSFTSTAEWSIETSGSVSWCTVSPSSGSSGSSKINVSAVKNTSYEDRQASYTIKSGVARKTVTVRQAAAQKVDEELEVSKDTFTFDADGGEGSFEITSNVSWTVSSSSAWCTVSPKNGKNNAKITFKVEKHTETSTRNATITVKSSSGQFREVGITQSGFVEELEVSESSFTFDSEGGEGSFDVTSNTSWTVSSTGDWCTVSPKSGKDNAKVTFKVSALTETSPRKATITVKTSNGKYQDVEISQNGAEVFDISPREVNISYVESEFEVKVTATMGFQLSSKPEWITETGSTKNNITTTYLFKAAENSDKAERKGAIVFCNDKEECVPVSVTQEGKTENPVLSVSTESLQFDSEGGEQTFTVSSNVDWTVSSPQSWCSVTPASASGNGTVKVKVSKHEQTSTRSTTITVKTDSGLTQTVKVEQTGIDVFEISPTEVSVPFGGGSFDIKVTSSIGYKISSHPDWISEAGFDRDVYTFKAEANPSESDRTGTIVFCNDKEVCIPVTVKQAGKPEDPKIEISVSSLSFECSASEKSVTVTSNTDWTASSDKSWCKVSPANGSGNATLTIKADDNNTTETRSATITVSTSSGLTRTIQVSQKGGDVFTISPTEVSLPSSGGAFDITVTSTLGFRMSSCPDWVKNVSTSNGGTVYNFRAEANTTAEKRSGTIVFCNDKEVCVPVSVTQEGATPSLEVTPMSVYFGENAESKKANVSSNMDWKITSSESWCTVSPSSGSGNSEITVSVQKNSSTASRTASLTVSTADGSISRTIVVSQDGNESSTFDWSKDFYHKSLLMKFTGNWCGYCPIMANTVHLYQQQYPGTLEVLNIYSSSGSLSNTAFNPLISLYNSNGSYPHGMVDGRQDLDNYSGDYGARLIRQFVEEQETNYPPVTTVGYNSSFSGSTLDIDLKMYIKKADSYKVTVIVTESNVIGKQADNYDGDHENYVHNDIARIAVTDVNGEAFTTSQDNLIVKRNYSVSVPTSYVKDNLKILVYIQRAYGSQTVIRSADYGDYYVDNCAAGKAGGRLGPAVGSEGSGGNEDLGNGNPINW